MARVKRGTNAKRRHKKILKQAKGFYGKRSKIFRAANPAVMRSLRSAYIGRKQRKRNFRRLWITRINAAARLNGTTYSRFIAGMRKNDVIINRKMLADIAVRDPQSFAKVIETALA